MVKDILNKLDTILNEPSQNSGNYVAKALQAIEDKDFVRAREHFHEATKKATTGIT